MNHKTRLQKLELAQEQGSKPFRVVYYEPDEGYSMKVPGEGIVYLSAEDYERLVETSLVFLVKFADVDEGKAGSEK